MTFLFVFLLVVICSIIYYPWFVTSTTLSSGDWPYLFKETIQSFSFSPNPSYLWLGPYYQITSKIFVEYLHIPWEIAEKVLWFWLFLFISFFSSWYFSITILKNKISAILSVLIFLTNTYILMIVGGGQIGVALGYAFAPLVIGQFIQFLKNTSWKNLLIGSIVLSLQVMFDPRIAYVTGIAVLLYCLISLIATRKKRIFTIRLFIFFLVSGISTFLLNSFWITRIIFTKDQAVSKELLNSSKGALEFFSFGSFSQSFSLLHPNWPENIFGKTYFLNSEFLILPLIAFSALLFLQKEKEEMKKNVVVFIFLVLLGAFLSKGVNEPFGQIYEWMFSNVPGLVLFRDPTKFYLLVVLGYIILIPYCIEKIVEKISNAYVAIKGKKSTKLKTYIRSLPVLVFIVFWVFLIHQAMLGQLTGTFKPRVVPPEYVTFKDFLNKDTNYSLVAWIPRHSSFSFFSNNHPISDSSFNTKLLSKNENNETLRRIARENNIRYVVIPQDIEGKIFLKDRKYDEKEYKKVVDILRKRSFLVPVKTFGKIVVFEIR